jgi:hypothetical protein
LDPAIVELDCRLKEALKLSKNKRIEQLKAKKKLVEKKEQAHSTAEQFRLLDLLELFGGNLELLRLPGFAPKRAIHSA